jgi:hypothetical protein
MNWKHRFTDERTNTLLIKETEKMKKLKKSNGK